MGAFWAPGVIFSRKNAIEDAIENFIDFGSQDADPAPAKVQNLHGSGLVIIFVILTVRNHCETICNHCETVRNCETICNHVKRRKKRFREGFTGFHYVSVP